MRFEDEIDQLLNEQRPDVIQVIKHWSCLSAAKRRDYGAAALFLVAALELAIRREKKKK